MFEKFVDDVSEVPSLFFKNMTDMAKSLQIKMRDYSDAATGKMNANNVSIAKVHANYITTVRSNADMYQKLLTYAKNYSNIDIDKQPELLDKVYSLIGGEAAKVNVEVKKPT